MPQISACLEELRNEWFPHVTDVGLDRIIELLHQASPLLIHGAFTRAAAQGCIASHIAWNHPRTCRLNQEAGITWLSRIAHLNPATSQVIAAWDCEGVQNFALRTAFLEACKEERERRQNHQTIKAANFQHIMEEC